MGAGHGHFVAIGPADVAPARRPRIAHLTNVYLPVLGGKESYVWNVVEHLPEFDFEILTARVPGVPPPTTSPNVRVHRLRPAEWFRGPFALPMLGQARLLWGAFSLTRLLRARELAAGCDVVHSHWSDVEMMDGLRRLVTRSGWQRMLQKTLTAATFPQPMVYTDHSMLVQETPEPVRMLLEHFLRSARLVVAVEPEGTVKANEMRDACGGTAKIEYIPNSVDTAVYRPREEDRRPGTVAYVGRANKAPWLLQEILRLLPEQRFVLAIAGYSRSMEKWRSMRSERVEVLENVPPDRLPAVLTRADVLVNPLLHNAMTRVTIEGLACGLPVVADEGLSRYPLVDGKTGRLVPPKPEAFASAVKGLLGNPALLKDYGREGRRIVEREFSNTVILPRLAAWYRRLSA